MAIIDFKDISIKEQLDQNGFAILPSFISSVLMKELQLFFSQTKSLANVDAPFFTTHWSSNLNYRQLVNEFVTNLLSPNLESHFEHYKVLFGYYLFKKSASENGVFMHKDWTLLDESLHTGYILWFPLVDTNTANGCFQVVPHSHLDSVPRGSNIPQNYPGITEQTFTSIPLLAGDAIIFDLRLLHASPPNNSNTDRLAVGIILAPKEAQTIHFYHDPITQKTTKFNVEDDFLVKSYYDYQKKDADDYILNIISQVKTNNRNEI